MPTPPRRWPTEVENERKEALRAASEAITILQKAQETLDTARSRLHGNQSLTTVLFADTERFVADASTRMERIRRHLSLARAKQLNNRWPMVATKQRDDADGSAEFAITLLTDAHDHLAQARSKLTTNPSLSEAIVADVANYQARALTLAERINRLLTEAGIGRD